MRPTPIPDGEVWTGAVRKVIAPPGGDLTDTTIAPVEALIDQSEIGQRFSMRCELEGDDLQRLQNGAVVWVSIYGDHLHPFSVDVAAAVPGPPSLHVVVDPGPQFRAWIDNLPDGVDPVIFTKGCIEALEHMLTRDVLSREVPDRSLTPAEAASEQQSAMEQFGSSPAS